MLKFEKVAFFDGYGEDADESVYALYLDDVDIGAARVVTSDEGSYLERIDINEDYQGKGYGAEFLYFLSREHDDIVIAPDNERAARLYARIGSEVSSFSDDYIYNQGFGVYIL